MKSKIKCHYCGKLGHIEHFCFKKKRDQQRESANISQEGNNETGEVGFMSFCHTCDEEDKYDKNDNNIIEYNNRKYDFYG